LVNIGWTANNSNAERNSVAANSAGASRKAADVAGFGDAGRTLETLSNDVMANDPDVAEAYRFPLNALFC
jgi:hypothetical protein